MGMQMRRAQGQQHLDAVGALDQRHQHGGRGQTSRGPKLWVEIMVSTQGKLLWPVCEETTARSRVQPETRLDG